MTHAARATLCLYSYRRRIDERTLDLIQVGTMLT